MESHYSGKNAPPGAVRSDRGTAGGTQPFRLHHPLQQARPAADRAAGGRHHGGLLPVARPAEDHHQRGDPGRQVPAARRHRRLPRLRARPPRVPARAVAGVPRADRAERLAQVPDQHHEGLDGRAHAAPPALPALRPDPALPDHALPPRQGRRDGDHDQGRGRAARRLHRRGADHAAVPRRPGADRDVLHPLPALGARPDRARGGGGPGGGDPEAAQAPAGAGTRAPTDRARARRAHRRDRRRRGRDPRQRHLELRARRDLGAPRAHLPHPLRVLPAQVPDQVPQQLPLAGDAVPVLHRGRLPGDHRPPRHRRAGRGDRGLQGPAQPGEGADRLGPAAPRRRDQVPAGGRAVHRRRGGAGRDAGARRRAAAAARGQAEGVEPPAGRRIGHQAGRGRLVRGRARPAHRHRRPARRGRERARADARAPGAADAAARSRWAGSTSRARRRR